MSAHAQDRGFLAAALARVEDFLLEPAEPVRGRGLHGLGLRRPVVAVFGLARRCGGTTVARGLAAELAARDGAQRPSRRPCRRRGSRSRRPPRRGWPRRGGRPTRPDAGGGRPCLVEGPSAAELADAAWLQVPLVLDAGSDQVGGAAAAVADHVVLVGAPAVEPALAAVVSSCLVRVGPEPIVALNRVTGESDWGGRATVELPEARMGAQLALGGREPRGGWPRHRGAGRPVRGAAGSLAAARRHRGTNVHSAALSRARMDVRRSGPRSSEDLRVSSTVTRAH